ncbi:hypothetical protein TNCV_3590861 [Trichonephila clavipes]|nr:hypothetical protein TNCV_3590861 [Trichonephila clavipes]
MFVVKGRRLPQQCRKNDGPGQRMTRYPFRNVFPASGLPLPLSLKFLPERFEQPMRITIITRYNQSESILLALHHELRFSYGLGNFPNDWLDQSADCYMLA